MKTKVLGKLKPKAASLGFNEEELERVANQIAGTLKEDATDDQIDKAVELILPFLQVSQTAANRVINAAKPPKKTDPEVKKDKGADPTKEDENEGLKSLREQIEALSKAVTGLTSSKISESRTALFTAKLEKLTPKQKADRLNDFNRMSFRDDEDFNSYLSEKETSFAEIVQEKANLGLKNMAKPGSGGTGNEPEKVSDEVQKRIDARKAEEVLPPIQGLK